MVKRRIPLRNVQNVAASKTALIECPVGPRYHQIILQHGYTAGTNTIAAAATNISEIRVKVNGRVQRTSSGTQLRALNIANGSVYDAVSTEAPNTAPGVSFPLFFAEPWRKDVVDADGLAWQTSKWASFQIEVDLSTASTPTLLAWAVVDDFVSPGNAVTPIVKWIRQSIGASGTSQDITTLDRRDFLQQVSIYDASGGGATSRVTLRKDGEILHDLTTSANAALLQQNGMTPASGRYDLVLDHDDLLSSAVDLNGARDLSITVESTSMSGSLVLIVQRLGPPE